MKSYLIDAIRKLKPNSEFVISNDDYATIEWHVLEGEAPTQAEINAAIKQIKADEITQAATKSAQKQALLDRLGITAEEAVLLLS
jgi:hypothetical protein